MNIYSRVPVITDIERPCIKNYKPTRLYINEHIVTKKKYFGKTVKSELGTYLGSGGYWNDHINKHGRDLVRNLWLSEPFLDPVELQEFALAFSELHNIVESHEWANQCPENGLSGGYYGGWDHITEEQRAKSKATINDLEWKATGGVDKKQRELETKSDPEWIKNVWEPALKKVSDAANARYDDEEWMATTYAAGKRKEMKTKSDPEWQATVWAERNRKVSEIMNDPEWWETTGRQAAEDRSDTLKKKLNDPIYKATTGRLAAERKSKTATGRRRTFTADGSPTWEYPDGKGGYVPFTEFKKIRESNE